MIIVSDGVYSLKTPYSGTCKTIVYVSGVLGTAVLSVGYYDEFFDTLVKQLNPDLSYQSKKFRSGPDDYCLEQTVLTTAQN